MKCPACSQDVSHLMTHDMLGRMVERWKRGHNSKAGTFYAFVSEPAWENLSRNTYSGKAGGFVINGAYVVIRKHNGDNTIIGTEAE